jgi:hypothetical protein
MSPTDCRHDTIVTWGTPDNRLWACASCSRLMYPACETCVDVGHRNETHSDREVEARQQERERLASLVEGLDPMTEPSDVYDAGFAWCKSRVLALLREPQP